MRVTRAGRKELREWVQTIALVAGGLWAIWLFFYQDRVVPSRIPPQLDVSSSLQVIGKRDNLLALKARVSMRNPSHTRVRVLGSWFNMFTYKVKAKKTPELSKTDVEELRGPNYQAHFIDFPRLAKMTGRTVVNSGRLLPPVWWFEPGEEYSQEFVTLVPSGSAIAELRCRFMIVRKQGVLRPKWDIDKDGVTTFSLLVPGEVVNKFEAYDASNVRHLKLLGGYLPVGTRSVVYSVLW